MADMNTIIGDLVAAIMSDSAIDVWCRAEYGQSLTVLENCDPRNDPTQEDCPLVVVFPVAKTGGLSGNEKNHVLGVSCAVFDSAKPESIEGVLRFTGGRNVEVLRASVVEVVRDNVATDIHIEAIVTEYNTIEQFPYVSANMEITLSQEKLIGGDPLE